MSLELLDVSLLLFFRFVKNMECDRDSEKAFDEAVGEIIVALSEEVTTRLNQHSEGKSLGRLKRKSCGIQNHNVLKNHPIMAAGRSCDLLVTA